MGYKVSFMDNEVYTAQDVNEHFSKLFSGGVSIVESGNILKDLNDMTNEIVGYGVLYDSCLVVKTTGGYKISAGSAFMHDGSSITFDKDGYEFSAERGKYRYVYLKRNEPENKIDVVVSETEPEGEYVLLAHITASGDVYDRREYARLKVSATQADTLRMFDISYYSSENYKDVAYDVGGGNFSYIIMFDSVYKLGTTEYRLFTPGNNILRLTDGVEISMPLKDGTGASRGSMHIKKNGQVIETRLATSSPTAEFLMHFGVI